MKKLILLTIASSMLGCAPVQLTKPGAGPSEYNADMAGCEYDAVKYAGTSDPMMRTAVGAGIEQGMRQRDLKIACMKSKGWAVQQKEGARDADSEDWTAKRLSN